MTSPNKSYSIQAEKQENIGALGLSLVSREPPCCQCGSLSPRCPAAQGAIFRTVCLLPYFPPNWYDSSYPTANACIWILLHKQKDLYRINQYRPLINVKSATSNTPPYLASQSEVHRMPCGRSNEDQPNPRLRCRFRRWRIQSNIIEVHRT